MITSLPTPNAIMGKILFLMMDGLERTRWDINRALGFSVEKETTARVRDLRKCGFDVPCTVRKHGGKTLHCYKMILNTDDELCLKVYRHIAEHLGSTFYEIAADLNEHVEKVHEKLCRLEALKVINEAEVRACNVMSTEQATYWLGR